MYVLSRQLSTICWLVVGGMALTKREQNSDVLTSFADKCGLRLGVELCLATGPVQGSLGNSDVSLLGKSLPGKETVMAVPRPEQLHNRRFAAGLRVRRLALPLAIALALTMSTIQAAPAQTFQVIYNFGSYGAHPLTGLTLDASGNLYGTTPGLPQRRDGVQAVAQGFRMGPERPVQLSAADTDGGVPDSRPVFGPGGLLYGSTSQGGGVGCQGYGCGTVYSLETGAAFFGQHLRQLDGKCSCIASPVARMGQPLSETSSSTRLATCTGLTKSALPDGVRFTP